MQYTELGKFIKFKRNELGLSLNKFAGIADIDPAILSRIENNKQGIKLNILINIADALDTTPAKFLDEFENKNDLI